jgi:hypothetical protein
MGKPFQWWISAFGADANSKTIVQTTGQAANKVMSQKAVTDALAGYASLGFDVELISAFAGLPRPGAKGIIYLVGAGAPYEEYVWLDSAQDYERIGSTPVDLSGYATLAEVGGKIAEAAQGKIDKAAAEALVKSVALSGEPGEEALIIVSSLNPQTGNAQQAAIDLPEATATAKGLMGAGDKQRLLSVGDGKNAYEIAQGNGFAGTPEEWLASLKGQDGDSFAFKGQKSTYEDLTSVSNPNIGDAWIVGKDLFIYSHIYHNPDGWLLAGKFLGEDGADGGTGTSGSANLAQQTVLEATAGQAIVLGVNNPSQKYLFAPPIALKFIAGAADVDVAFGFSEGDAEDWLIGGQSAAQDGQVIMDGTMRLKTEFEYEFGEPEALGEGFVSECEIDFTKFKQVILVD